jgi:hypothetical protein
MIKKEVIVSASVGSENNSSKETNDAETKRLLLDTIIKRIDYYCSKNTVTDVDLYYLVKDFFRVFLDLKYEFSLDELILELDRIYLDSDQRDKTFKFINNIKIVEYHDSTFTEIQIRGYIMEFSEIAKLLLKNTEYEMGSWLKRFLLRFRKKRKAPDAAELDYYKQSHSNEQVNVPMPAVVAAPEKFIQEADDVYAKQLEKSNQNNDDSEVEKEETTIEPAQYDNSSAETAQMQEDEQESNEQEIEQEITPPPTRPKRNINLPNYEPKSWDEEVDPRILEMEKSDKNTWDKSSNKMQDEQETQIQSTDNDLWPDLEENEIKKTDTTYSNKEDTTYTGKINEAFDDESDELEEERADPSLRKSLKKYRKEIQEEKSQKKQKATLKKTKTTKKEKSKKSVKLSGFAQTDFESPELDKLLEKSKKIKKKSELVELYKLLNAKYVRTKIEIQSKYYDDVMAVYKRIAKLKE